MSRWHRHITTTATVLSLLTSIMLPQRVFAIDDWNVDGEHGELHVHGLLLEGACQLNMSSAWQQVSLGSLARTTLAKPGDLGRGISFQIKLCRCSRSGGEQTDQYLDNRIQDAIQPVVTLSFMGVSDPDKPSLLKVIGVRGLGLALSTPLNRRIILGQRGEPLMLTPGDNILTFTVTPVRTIAPLTTGNFRAVAGFEVSYD